MTPPPFAGWLRPRGGAWRLACRADTEQRCWELLRAAIAEQRGDHDAIVNRGRHPDHRRRPR